MSPSTSLRRNLQILLNYIHSHRQSWVKRDIHAILDEPEVAGVRDFPYLGIHIRRGDKAVTEAKPHDVQVKLGTRKLYSMHNRLVSPVKIPGLCCTKILQI